MGRRLGHFGLRETAVAVLLLFMAGCAGTEITPTQTSYPAASQPAASSQAAPPRAAAVYAPGFQLAPYIPPPQNMDLCGEPVPLHNQEVRERFDKEFTLIVYNHAQVYLWLKRMERYFPMIEDRLQSFGLPDDLKWVAIVESDLQPNVCSPKGAAGPWQFMPSTGAAYGLKQTGSVDRRYDFERSTDGAFQLLGDLFRRHKSWSLAIAAYNCGDKRILDEMRQQRVTSYYDMKLPLETERYVFRILAIKAVLGNAAHYGYVLPKGQGYEELKPDRVSLNLSSPVPISAAAAAANTTFREFKRLNPSLRTDDIPAGTTEIKVPEGMGSAFAQNMQDYRGVPVTQTAKSVEPAPVSSAPAKKTQAAAPASSSQDRKMSQQRYHTVKKGETLSGIARQYDVSVQEIKSMNKLRSDSISQGDRIRVK